MTWLEFYERVREGLREWARGKGIGLDVELTIEKPPDRRFGDLSTNLPFRAAKGLGKRPREVAEDLANA